MLLRVSSAVALLPVASRVGVKSLPAIARRGKGIASLVAPQSPASVLFPRLARRSMTVRACMSPEEVVAAVDAQANEVRRLKDQGLGNKSPEVSAAVTELLRLKALLPPPTLILTLTITLTLTLALTLTLTRRCCRPRRVAPRRPPRSRRRSPLRPPRRLRHSLRTWRVRSWTGRHARA